MRVATPSRTLLHRALLIDALASGAMGVPLALAGQPLAALFRLPEPLLRGAGLVLLPFAIAVAYAGTRPIVPRGAAWAIVALNMLWVVASVALLVAVSPSPTALGGGFVIAQALAVLVFAEAQWIGLRRTSTFATAT